MSKEVKDKVVPKLRFPEFRDKTEWEETTLEHKAEYENGKAHENDILESGQYIVVNSKFISSNGAVRKFTNSAFCLADKGDILMVLSDVPNGKAIAKCFYVDTNKTYTVNQRISKLKPRNANGLLLYYILNRNSYFLAFDDGVKQTNLKNDDVLNCPMVLPKDLKEQQKIADCLSSLDELITAQSQKLEALKAHKKGLMQQLFPAEGETVPKLRFAEFKDSGEWKEKTLGEVANYENGKAHEQDIAEAGSFVVVNSKFISSDGEVKKFTNTAFCLAKKGDILMVLSDVPNGKAIAKCFLVDADNLYSVNQRICKLTPHDANNVFLFYILNRNAHFLSFDDGVKQTNLRNEDVLNCPILLPKSPVEQKKIADCIYSLNELVIEQAKRIEALKTHKKGLMQQLFPNTQDISE